MHYFCSLRHNKKHGEQHAIKFREQPLLPKKYFLLLVLVLKITLVPQWGTAGACIQNPRAIIQSTSLIQSTRLWLRGSGSTLQTQAVPSLPACCNLSKVSTSWSISSSCNKSVMIRLVATCNLQTFLTC